MPNRFSAKELFSGRRSTWLAGAAAAVAAAAWVNVKSRQAERESPPHGLFVDVDGVRLHYVDRGQGTPVVFIHGNGSMIEDVQLSGVLDMLASRYRVIVFDRPGFGHSDRPRMKTWTPQAQADLLYKALRQIDVERPVLAAHSFGTQVAMAMAVRHPYFVRSMVLVSGYYYPTARLDVPLLAMPAIPVIGDLIRHTISPLLTRLMWPLLKRRVFGPSPVPDRFREHFPVWLALRPSQLRAAAAESGLMIPAAAALRRHYTEVTMPVVIVAGDGDRMVDTYTQSVRLQQDLPHAVLQIVPGAGHMLHYLAPEQIVFAVDAAVDGAEMDEGEPVKVNAELRARPSPSQGSGLLH